MATWRHLTRVTAPANRACFAHCAGPAVCALALEDTASRHGRGVQRAAAVAAILARRRIARRLHFAARAAPAASSGAVAPVADRRPGDVLARPAVLAGQGLARWRNVAVVPAPGAGAGALVLSCRAGGRSAVARPAVLARCRVTCCRHDSGAVPEAPSESLAGVRIPAILVDARVAADIRAAIPSVIAGVQRSRKRRTIPKSDDNACVAVRGVSWVRRVACICLAAGRLVSGHTHVAHRAGAFQGCRRRVVLKTFSAV